VIIAPFPFEAWPKLTHADVRARRRVRDLAAKYAPFAAVAQALSETLNAPVRIRLGQARGVVEGVTVPLDGVVVNVETALAREVVARAMKHPPGIDAGLRASPALHGAFAAVLVHALRKIGGARLAQSRAAEKAIAVRLAVDVAGASFDASLTIPDRVLAPPAPPRALDFTIALPIVALSCLTARDDARTLAPGDVFVPPGLMKSALALVPSHGERGLAVELTSSPRLVIGKETHHSWDLPMTAESNANPTLEVALEAPVVVRVELGAVEMKAREWASLAEGDVITLQRKLGEPAILRIAGQEVARGELVQVDGEYGVRITSTIGANVSR
jgi:flagellar motor switch/type III secretory pathway protein FliN